MNRKTWLRKFIAFIMLIIGFNVFINCSDSTSAQNDSEKKYDLQKNTGAVTGKIFSYDIKKDSKIVLQSQSREDEIYDIELNSENKFLIINLEPGYYRLTDYKKEFHKDIPVIKDSITVIPTFFYKQPEFAVPDISKHKVDTPTVYRIVNGDTLISLFVRCSKEIDKTYLQNLGLIVNSIFEGPDYIIATGEIDINKFEILKADTNLTYELDRVGYLEFEQPKFAVPDISKHKVDTPTVYRIVNGDTLVGLFFRCNKEIDKSYLQNLGLIVRMFMQGPDFTWGTGEINIKNLSMLKSVCEVELATKCYIDPGIPEINVPEPGSSPDIMDEEPTIILDSTISNNFWFFIPLNDTNIAK